MYTHNPKEIKGKFMVPHRNLDTVPIADRMQPYRLIFPLDQPLQECITMALLLQAVLLVDAGEAFYREARYAVSGTLRTTILVPYN